MSNLIDNYIYLYSYDEFLVIPVYPDSISDSASASYGESTALSRSAPIYSYSHSGPRTVRITLALHRDLLDGVNINVSNMKVEIGDDYIDTLIKRLQTIVIPKYSIGAKAVEPPMIAVRFGNELFIKGVVNGTLSIEYSKPILEDNKYANVSISFDVTEVDPYDSQSVYEQGSFRGLTKSFKNGIYK